jgi:uncharacterized coiled-coil protein SlyX
MDQGQEGTLKPQENVDKGKGLSDDRYNYLKQWLHENIGTANAVVQSEGATVPNTPKWFRDTFAVLREMLDYQSTQANRIAELEKQVAYATEIMENLNKKFKKHEPTLKELTTYFRRMQRKMKN